MDATHLTFFISLPPHPPQKSTGVPMRRGRDGWTDPSWITWRGDPLKMSWNKIMRTLNRIYCLFMLVFLLDVIFIFTTRHPPIPWVP